VGFNIAAHSVSMPNGEILIQPPVYPPFFKTGSYAGLKTVENALIQDETGRYGIDFKDFENKVTDNTRMFLLCNPHNPVGRVFKREELEHCGNFSARTSCFALTRFTAI
jgi:cystathionine beta-lyase